MKNIWWKESVKERTERKREKENENEKENWEMIK